MAVTKEQVVSTLKAKLGPSHLVLAIRESRFKGNVNTRGHSDINPWWPIEVIDTSGRCGPSFKIEIVSELFEGKRLLERHRFVNAALVEEMKHIHALSITKALTPEQWKQQEAQKIQPTA